MIHSTVYDNIFRCIPNDEHIPSDPALDVVYLGGFFDPQLAAFNGCLLRDDLQGTYGSRLCQLRAASPLHGQRARVYSSSKYLSAY